MLLQGVEDVDPAPPCTPLAPAGETKRRKTTRRMTIRRLTAREEGEEGRG